MSIYPKKLYVLEKNGFEYLKKLKEQLLSTMNGLFTAYKHNFSTTEAMFLEKTFVPSKISLHFSFFKKPIKK